MGMITKANNASLGFKQFGKRVGHSLKKHTIDNPKEQVVTKARSAIASVKSSLNKNRDRLALSIMTAENKNIIKANSSSSSREVLDTVAESQAKQNIGSRLSKFAKSAASKTANLGVKAISTPLRMTTSVLERTSANLGDPTALKAIHKNQVEKEFNGKFKNTEAKWDNSSKLNESDTAFVSTLKFLKDPENNLPDMLNGLSENKLQILLDAFDKNSFTKKHAYVDHIFKDINTKGIKEALKDAHTGVVDGKKSSFETAVNAVLSTGAEILEEKEQLELAIKAYKALNNSRGNEWGKNITKEQRDLMNAIKKVVNNPTEKNKENFRTEHTKAKKAKEKIAATTIQSAVRGYQAKKDFQAKKAAATTIQTAVREYQAKKAAATTIQTAVREYQEKKDFQAKKAIPAEADDDKTVVINNTKTSKISGGGS